MYWVERKERERKGKLILRLVFEFSLKEVNLKFDKL